MGYGFITSDVFNRADGQTWYRLINISDEVKEWLDAQPPDWYQKFTGVTIGLHPNIKWTYDVNEQIYKMLLIKWR